MTTLPRLSVMLAALAVIWCSPAAAEEWSRANISRLPDSAFAVVEAAPDGRKVRHLPHHDESGAVDLAHLRAARSRLGSGEVARPRKRGRCAPTSGGALARAEPHPPSLTPSTLPAILPAVPADQIIGRA